MPDRDALRDPEAGLSADPRAGLSADHAEYLASHAVDPDKATALGVCSVASVEDLPEDRRAGLGRHLPGILFPWVAPGGRTEYQLRPDQPVRDEDGRERKYVFRSKEAGYRPVLWAVRPVEAPARVVIVEGTKPALAAASHAPEGVSVYGIAGCRMWSTDGIPTGDLAVVDGRDVVVILDADATSNRQVFDAGMSLREALETEGAASVRFARLPATGTAGLDDVLASREEDRRAVYLRRLIEGATKTKPADRRPKGKGASPPTGLEALEVTNTADAADWLRQRIGTGPLAGYFNRDDQVVHCPAEGEDGYIPLSEDEHDHDGPAQVRRAGPDRLVAHLGFTYWCFTETKEGRAHATFPALAARIVTNAVDMLPNLRRLRGVTHTPLVRRDGTILDTPGYDPATGLMFLPAPDLAVPQVPERPSRTEVKTAVALLDELVWDFPFRSSDHRANYLGLLLTPLLRELTPPPYKLGVFDAPMSRSGKTLLTLVLRTLHGGVVRASTPTDEAEWSKTLSTILNVTTAPVVTFDNVRGELKSGTLDGLLTSASFDARQLGRTDDMIQRRNDRLWTITSNNARLGGDLVKRALWVSVDPGVAEPEARTGFRHPDLPGWVAEHRGELLAALLALVRAWVVAGRPPPAQQGTDTWAYWSTTVRAILEHAGVPGTFDQPDSRIQGTSDEDVEWGTFLRAAYRVFGDRPWTCRELLGQVRKFEGAHGDIHPDELPGDLGERHAKHGQDVAKSLGRWLKYRPGTWALGYVARPAGEEGRSRTKLWRIERSEGAGPPGEPAGFAGFAGSLSTLSPFQDTTFPDDLERKGVPEKRGRVETDPANPANPAPDDPSPNGHRPTPAPSACTRCGSPDTFEHGLCFECDAGVSGP